MKWALHKTRHSNDDPDFFLDAAQARAERFAKAYEEMLPKDLAALRGEADRSIPGAEPNPNG